MAQITKAEFTDWVARVLNADMAECDVAADGSIVVTPIDPINGAPTFRLIVTTENEPHLIELRVDGWTIQHPGACRPNLFACPVNRVAQVDIPRPQPAALGVFEVELNDDGDRLVVGERVDGEPS
jgi:hypothetical protein